MRRKITLMHKKRLYAFDLLILAFAIAFALLLLFFLGKGKDTLSQITVKSDGKAVATLDLFENSVYKVDGKNFEIEIKDGKVLVINTDCPDRLCVGMTVDKRGGSIVCLPNRIVIEGVFSDYDYKAG